MTSPTSATTCRLITRRPLRARARLAGPAAHRAALLHAVVAAGRAHARDGAGDPRDLGLLGRQARLRFEGEFYTPHADDPGLRSRAEPVRPAADLLGGFGPRMTEVAGEVADGFIAHPFNTRKSLLENVAAGARARARARRPRARADLEIVCATIVVTADERGRVRARHGCAVTQAARLLRLDAGLPADARLPRLGRAAPRAQSPVEGRAAGTT